MADRPLWGTWQPQKLDWWIATLFMIGSAFFGSGCIFYLKGFTQEFTLTSLFFVGSIFFTSAAYCQLHQEIALRYSKKSKEDQKFRWSPDEINYWSALSQFIGTLFFNVDTFDAYFSFGWLGQDLLVWTPNLLGSVLFQISSCLAIFNVSKNRRRSKAQRIDWWIDVIILVGCCTFLISAVLAYTLPSSELEINANAATVFTLIGACCFFIGAFLMWPAIAMEET